MPRETCKPAERKWALHPARVADLAHTIPLCRKGAPFVRGEKPKQYPQELKVVYFNTLVPESKEFYWCK